MMAGSTTLMTFMVRTPFTTHTVDLYGSWDNFSTPYPMSRDTRLGREHWSGCHRFENIVCDGNVDGLRRSRNGGLKMGGTYWYYYKLDDELEFHNTAEPATTCCPLLPGQLVNELQVPFVFCGSQKRDASTSSTSSERMTLDPEAKFVNPRPVPTPPKTLRLNTSPTTSAHASPSISRVRNDSISAAPLAQIEREEYNRETPARIFHLPRKPSLDALLKVRSTKQSSAKLRPAFQLTDKDMSVCRDYKYGDIVNWIPGRMAPEQDSHSFGTEVKAQTDLVPAKPPRGGLLLRSYSEEAITLPSFSAHRRERSRSRSRSRTPQPSGMHDEITLLALEGTQDMGSREPLSALIEVQTPECTPAHGPMTGRRIALEALEGRRDGDLQCEKRLPTLPNTPSSAYPPTLLQNSPPQVKLHQSVNLDSRFSATTIDTTCHLDSIIMETAPDFHFFEFDGHFGHSPTLETTIEDDIGSPLGTEGYLDPLLRATTSGGVTCIGLSGDDYGLDLPSTSSAALSCTAISSSAVSITPTIIYDESYVVENNGSSSSRLSYATSIQSEEASSGALQQYYTLPDTENVSEVTLKQFGAPKDDDEDDDDGRLRSRGRRYSSGLSHSEGMQQLLDELSYLSAMIQG